MQRSPSFKLKNCSNRITGSFGVILDETPVYCGGDTGGSDDFGNILETKCFKFDKKISSWVQVNDFSITTSSYSG